MSKTKASKSDAAKLSKKESKKPELTSVKEGRVTKTTQTPKAKSKGIAKSAAVSHAVQEELKKKKKKARKEPTPEPESDSSESSASDNEEDESSDSDASSSEEEVTKKAPAKLNGSAKPKAKVESDSSDSSSESSGSASESDSDASESEEETTTARPNGVSIPAPKAVSDKDSGSDSESSSDESESSEDEPDAAKTASKAKVNGTAKVEKAAKAETSDSDSAGSSEDSDSEAADSSEDSSDSESEEEAPSKKRKAENEATPVVKKTKTEDTEEGIKNLFVGNLSWNVDEEWLSREFEEFGEIVGCRVVTDRETGRAKGFGYVEFASAAAAKAAKDTKHQSELDGRPMNIDFSTPRPQQGGGFKEKSFERAKKFGDSHSAPSNTLFIGNISFNATNDMISEQFQEYGSITRVSLPTDRESGAPKGFGYVDFTTTEEAKAALEALNGADIAGRPIRIDYASPRDGNGGQRGGFGGRGRGGDRGGRGGGFGGRGGRGGARGGRGGTTNRGGFGDFKGSKMTF